jgi:hypothetical protein
MALRNPSHKPQDFRITPQTALGLPAGVKDKMTLHAVYPREQQLATGAVEIGHHNPQGDLALDESKYFDEDKKEFE